MTGSMVVIAKLVDHDFVSLRENTTLFTSLETTYPGPMDLTDSFIRVTRFPFKK